MMNRKEESCKHIGISKRLRTLRTLTCIENAYVPAGGLSALNDCTSHEKRENNKAQAGAMCLGQGGGSPLTRFLETPTWRAVMTP